MIHPIIKGLSLLINQILAGRGATNFWARLLGRLWREDGLSNGAGGRGGG